MRRRLRRIPVGLAAVLAAAAAMGLLAPASADASYLLARNAKNVKLEINTKGMALVTYRDRGGVRRVLAWGAMNDQLAFKIDRSGGFATFKRPVWKSFEDASTAYDGPALGWLVAARRAPDGSYWALQAWQRMLPNQGYQPWKPVQSAWELHLSHWSGDVPRLELWLDWVTSKRFHHLFGRYTYLGKPVFGFKSTRSGNPLDAFGRNIYLDTLDSAYGSGWLRENSFLTHRPNGNFCYGFYPRRSYYEAVRRPSGHGARYRATVIGPGVAPDAYWEGSGLGAFDPDHEAAMNALNESIAAGDARCRMH